ncbi:patatin-like phospholipase family protein [Cryobacterium psychrophilum]|uniref:Patatin-like phospholipase family protein n=1 Tax=Cryobacterium psychrophilum TaxID=41988 RepID=A0A4Y8KQL4_9MICO|nr:patatin-like phospholipase family protein [Cryobacterium psychrophilum]TDW30774.1 patatin-like phospholipase [Cryobacterium psychrophilum]TFD75824.1 patatin-like phospholipase family protein [Cryobacterium psychrophilum]
MKRSLVLAGGGMRVAWQTGVVKALTEEGLSFDHYDGTSGGILTAAMLLSGLRADDMVALWSALDVGDFASGLPLKEYLKGPWSLQAFGDADGIRDQVFPGLGIDVARIRSTDIAGTFNVADFTHKRSIAFEAGEIDAELLAAGMSLPIFMTPLRRDGVVYTDAVWIRDANVAEALRRGAEEIWLVWCIGNTGYYGDGPLEQYVHMIEMSATGALLADFAEAAAAGRRFVLHVVKPQHPLPLDPEYFLGRISTDSLIAMGYRDARAYLDAASPTGVPADAACTAMTEHAPGIRYVEGLSAKVHGVRLTLSVTVVLPLPGESAVPELAGFLDYAPWGARIFLAGGAVDIDGARVTYTARILHDGAWLRLSARRDLTDDPGWDAWGDMNTVELAVHDAQDTLVLSSDLTLGVRGLRRLVASVEPVGTHGLVSRADAIRRVLVKVLGRN